MRAVIKFLFLQGKELKEIHAILTETLTCFLPGLAKVLSAPQYKYVLQLVLFHLLNSIEQLDHTNYTTLNRKGTGGRQLWFSWTHYLRLYLKYLRKSTNKPKIIRSKTDIWSMYIQSLRKWEYYSLKQICTNIIIYLFCYWNWANIFASKARSNSGNFQL